MSQGNIQGIVTNPSGAAVGQVGINVMRREGSNWMWVESWAEASQSISTLGRFSLDLRPDSGTATYQLTARPWGGTFSPGKATIQVNSSGNWCVVTTGDACTVTGTNPSNFTIALANPNVVGRVLDTSSQPVRDAWVDLQKWVEPSGTNGQPDYRPGYWNYLSGVGDNTDGLGAFQMFIDQPGSYRVSVNPPWNESGLAPHGVGSWPQWRSAIPESQYCADPADAGKFNRKGARCLGEPRESRGRRAKPMAELDLGRRQQQSSGTGESLLHDPRHVPPRGEPAVAIEFARSVHHW